MPAYLIVFVCSGLLVYWAARTLLLLQGSSEAIDEALAYDQWWGRKLLPGLSTAFGPPQ